ncbi:MAG: hypothetical protein EBT15_12735 [Betaproteobacteria bacterium]|nr:hypothetical protein [Betaproteobacteria bacterium]
MTQHAAERDAMLDGMVETLRREIPLPSPNCALQDGIVAVNRANRERRAAAQCIENLALTEVERAAVQRSIWECEATAGLASEAVNIEAAQRDAAVLKALLQRL